MDLKNLWYMVMSTIWLVFSSPLGTPICGPGNWSLELDGEAHRGGAL
jgi:hypothetical protein